jgi:hypothetical protein
VYSIQHYKQTNKQTKSLKFHISSKPVILKLQENTQFKTRIPTYIICENGSIVEDIQSNDLQVSNDFFPILGRAPPSSAPEDDS